MKPHSRALLGLLALAACRRAPDRAAVATARPSDPTPIVSYTADAVLDGAELVVHVQWSGTPPALAPVVVPASANPAICGAEQALPLLSLGNVGGVAATVVWIADITRGKPPDDAVPTVDQRRCQYEPHVVAQMVGRPVRFASSDATILHTVRSYHGYGPVESWFTRATPHGVSFEMPVDHAGVNTLYCDSGHTWMIGYVIGVANPYFAVSDTLGDMVIDRIPPGAHRLHAWHEGFRPTGVTAAGRAEYGPAIEADVPFSVRAGETAHVELTLGVSTMTAVVRARNVPDHAAD